MLWQTNDLSEKNRLQKMIFPYGIKWDGSSFGTPVTHSFFTLLADATATNAVLVAPQGTICLQNKGDSEFSTAIPRNVPQIIQQSGIHNLPISSLFRVR
jgi:hypothetical protein